MVYQDVQHALERCMAANPTDGAEHRLSKDASLIADILGEMIYLKAEHLPATSITATIQLNGRYGTLARNADEWSLSTSASANAASGPDSQMNLF